MLKSPRRSSMRAAGGHQKTAMIRVRVDPGLKADAEATFAEVGLSASTAISLFYTQVVQYRGLPFEVRVARASAGSAPVETAWAVLRRRAGTVPAPADWASEHDHYVHGTGRRRRRPDAA